MWGAVTVFLALVGMVEAFAGRHLVEGALPLGVLLPMLAWAGAGYQTAAGRPVVPALAGGSLAGAVAGLAVTVLVVAGMLLNLRQVFVNASPMLFMLLSFGDDGPAGIVLPIAAGAAAGGMSAVVAILPVAARRPLVVGLAAVLTVGLFQEMLQGMLIDLPLGNWGAPPVWRAGANVTTRLSTEATLVFGERQVPPGEYSLFIDVKGPNDWTLIVSNWQPQRFFNPADREQLWGAFRYTPDKDVVRAPMKLAMESQAAVGISHIKSFSRALKNFEFEHALDERNPQERIVHEPIGVADVFVSGTPRVYAHFAIAAPPHFSERVRFRWTHDGRTLQKEFATSITGGRKTGFRTWGVVTHPADGDWKVELLAESGQLIGRVRFQVLPEAPPSSIAPVTSTNSSTSTNGSEPVLCTPRPCSGPSGRWAFPAAC